MTVRDGITYRHVTAGRHMQVYSSKGTALSGLTWLIGMQNLHQLRREKTAIQIIVVEGTIIVEVK